MQVLLFNHTHHTVHQYLLQIDKWKQTGRLFTVKAIVDLAHLPASSWLFVCVLRASFDSRCVAFYSWNCVYLIKRQKTLDYLVGNLLTLKLMTSLLNTIFIFVVSHWDSRLNFYSGPFLTNLNDDDLLSVYTRSHLDILQAFFLPHIFYLEDFSSTQEEVKALKPSVHMSSAETSAVDASLSGPEEVDIFPAVVCSTTWVILNTHYLWWRTSKAELYSTTAAGFCKTLPENFRTLGSCSICKPQESLVSQIYTVTSLNIIRSLESEQ